MLAIISNVARRLGDRFAHWRELQRAEAELYALDDRGLADIGISRSEIPYLLAQPGEAAAPVRPRLDAHKIRHAA